MDLSLNTVASSVVMAELSTSSRVLWIINARAAWMFHGRAYAGGRFACLFRIAYMGTP